jgi:hypothetical protein
MKRVILAIAVTCILSVPAWAGDVPTVDYTQPPPPPPEQKSSGSQTVAGDIPTSDSPSNYSFEALVILIAQLMAR